MAKAGENVVYPIYEAVKVYATLGEISDVFKKGLRRAQGKGDYLIVYGSFYSI